MWERPNCLRNLHESAFIMFCIILREVDLENVSHNVRWNLRSFCEHIDFRYQVSCSKLWEFVTRISNAAICKTNTFSQFFVPFLNSTSNLEHFEKKEIVIANLFPKLQSVKIFIRKRSKEHRFRTGFGSQHVKASQMLAKSRWERFYHVFSSFSTKSIWKISTLVLGEILEGCFLTPWLPMTNILFKAVRICNFQFKCSYLKNENDFLNFLFHFWNLRQSLNILKKNLIVIANVSPKLQTVNILVFYSLFMFISPKQ